MKVFYLEKINNSTFENISDVLKAAGMAMMSSMGGASGALFGTLFRNGGKALEGKEVFDSDGIRLFLESANEGVKSRGGASVGDKTMIDALEPAAKEAMNHTSLPLFESIKLVAQAAEEGKEKSKDMIATMGRAKTLGERSLGHPDAGACSIAIIFESMSKFINK